MTFFNPPDPRGSPGAFMKFSKIKSAIALLLIFAESPNCFAAYDILGKDHAIITRSVQLKSGVQGLSIQNCEYDPKSRTYKNCAPLGKRVFYTDEEIASVKMNAANQADKNAMEYLYDGALAGGSAGAVAGAICTVLTGGSFALIVGGTAIVSSVILGGWGYAAGKGEGKSKSNSISKGLSSDQSITVDPTEFNLALHYLIYELNALDNE